MRLFLTLLPFAVLTVLSLVALKPVALLAAAAVAALLVAVDLYRGRTLKIFQLGAALLFAMIGGSMAVADGRVSDVAARVALDSGLLVVALGSIALRFPFTIQYARESVDAEIAARPDFLRANYVLTWVWTAAFVAMLAVDLGAIYAPWLPLWTGLAAALVARNGAAAFTQWYAARRRAKVAAERASVAPDIVSGAAA